MSDKNNDIEKQQEILLEVTQDLEPVVGGEVSEDSTAEEKKESSSPDGAEEKPQPLPTGSVLGGKTIEDVIEREAKEEQDTSSPFSLSKTLGGVIIARALQKQIWLVLLICAFLIIYINNRYICQKKMVEIAKTEQLLMKARYKATVCTSILTEKSRESNIMELLYNYGDSTLTIPTDPPYLITVKDE